MILTILALLAYGQYLESIRDEDVEEEALTLGIKGLVFTVLWPFFIIAQFRHLLTDRHKVGWLLISTPLCLTPLLVFGIWNHLALGFVFTLIRGVAFLYVAHRIHSRSQSAGTP